MKIFKILNSDQITFLKDEIEKCTWKNGTSSAEGTAKLIKRNLQISSSDPKFSNILKTIIQVQEDVTVKTYTYIKELIDPRIAKYSEGDEYDWHVDTALLNSRRTDLSFTIFLNDYSEYEGGQLKILNNSQEFIINGNAGQMVVYPSGLMHKVNKVELGQRLVIVGWINSHVKIEEHRLRLFEISTEISNLRQQHGIISENLNKIYFQLIRDYCN
jgi:PKHD-type hydroxylase